MESQLKMRQDEAQAVVDLTNGLKNVMYSSGNIPEQLQAEWSQIIKLQGKLFRKMLSDWNITFTGKNQLGVKPVED